MDFPPTGGIHIFLTLIGIFYDHRNDQKTDNKRRKNRQNNGGHQSLYNSIANVCIVVGKRKVFIEMILF